MAKADKNQELLAFLIEKHGGEEVVYQQFYGEQLGDLASQDLTLKEVRAAAKEDGWLSTLDDMLLTSIANIVNPPHNAPSRPGRPGKRLTKEEIEQAREEVLTFLEGHPWQSKNAIADGIGFDSKKLGPQLKALKDEEKLKSAGEKAGMRYALKAENTKPPK